MPAEKERSLGFWCSRISQLYFAMLNERLRHLGLERGYFVLSLIVESHGRISQQELADALHLDKVAMVRYIDHLCEQGYVQRASCPDDRRKHHFKLMPGAVEAVKEIKQAYAALDRTALRQLQPAGRTALIHELRTALGNLHAEAGEVPVKKKKQRDP